MPNRKFLSGLATVLMLAGGSAAQAQVFVPVAPAPYYVVPVPPPVYYPPVYYPAYIPPAPPTIVAPRPQTWYYCDNPKGYYPNVQSCGSGWREVGATPR